MKAKLTDVCHVGPAGAATRLDITRTRSDPADSVATLGMYWLVCPGQSPYWDTYTLAIIHLRDIPGVKPAHIRLPGATHELFLTALDPTHNVHPEKPKTWKHLTPINLMEQVILPDPPEGDEAALNLLDMAAKAIVGGLTWAEPPLSGQIEPWRTMLIKTTAHLRGEEHAP